MKERIRFEESAGKIEFVYTERIDDKSHRQVDGEVPERIVKQGKKAIREYALRKVSQAKKKWRKFEAIKENIRKNHIKIQTEYKDGALLEGRIVEATSRFIGVKLDKPLKGEGSMNYGYASAMSGQFVFDKGHKISEHGYDGAYRALYYAYERALHKPQKDLVRKLNSRS